MGDEIGHVGVVLTAESQHFGVVGKLDECGDDIVRERRDEEDQNHGDENHGDATSLSQHTPFGLEEPCQLKDLGLSLDIFYLFLMLLGLPTGCGSHNQQKVGLLSDGSESSVGSPTQE